MSNVAFCRPLMRGMRGDDVVAHKRALSRWNPHVYPWQQFTDFYGPYFEQAVKEFQRRHALTASGRIGKGAHEALERATAKEGGPAFDARAAALAAEFCKQFEKTPEERAREAIVDAGWFWFTHRAAISYSQARPMELCKPPEVPRHWDCSGFVTNCHYAGGAPDPNGRGYDAEGYTGTLMDHGTRVSSIAELKPGDLVFYGYTTSGKPGFPVGSPTHVALYAGVVNGVQSVLSLGHYPMSLYRWNYRSVNHLRTYHVA